ncbi:MAG: HYR domain-containing protein, partial [Flavobacteriales bacterium]
MICSMFICHCVRLFPTNITLSNTSINEKIPAPAIVGTFNTIDSDLGDTFTYTLVSGIGSTNNSSFNISGNTLRITQSPDFSVQSTYLIRVRTTDASGTFLEKTFIITVNDVTKPIITLVANTSRNTTSGQCAYVIQGTEFNPTSVTDNSGNITTLSYSVQRLLPNPNLITENFNSGSWNATNFEIGSPNGSVVNGAYRSAAADNRGTLRTTANWIPSINNPLHVSATLSFSGSALAFIGTRSNGLKNPSSSNEPNNSQYFRIHNFNNGQTDISSTSYSGRPGNTFYNNPVRVQFIDNGINITGTMTNMVTNQVLSYNQNTSYSSGSWRVVFSGSNVNWDDIKISSGAHEYLQEVSNGSNTLAGNSLAIGENTIIWTAVDQAGNSISQTMKVTVVDNQKPTITASSNVEEFTTQGISNKSITINNAIVNDNCTTTTLTWALTGATVANGTNQIGTRTFNRGLTTITYAATDAAGNRENASFTVSVKEAQTITFASLTAKTYGDSDFVPGASTSSNLAIAYTSSNTDVATIVNGAIKIVGAGTSTITANQAGSNLFQAATAETQLLTVNKKALTATAQSISKIYNGSDAATITFNSFTTATGLVGSDDINASYTTATYDTKNVGTNKTITITDLVLLGDDKDNYSLNSFSTTGIITKQTINVTAQADTKTYDGNTTSTVVPITATLA